MKNRWMILWVLAAAYLGCDRPDSGSEAEHPKTIYLLTIDALRADVIGLEYQGKMVTPNLNRFAEESVYFARSYSQAPFTKISVASLFTGLWPSRLGVKHCIIKIFPEGTELCRGLDFRFHTLAEFLVERGYGTYTRLFTAHVRKGDGLVQGFRYQERDLPERFDRHEKNFIYDHVIGLHAPYQPSGEALQHLGIRRHLQPDPTRNDWYWTPLTRRQGRHLHEYYLAEGYDWDLRFGELRKKLEERGLWDDALVIVTADHGEEFLEHGTTQHSVQMYDEVLRVPLIFKFPKKSRWASQHGSRFHNRVRLADIFPTIVHLLDEAEPGGFSGRSGFDGKSLLPILEGVESDEEKRPVLAYASISRELNGERVNFESRALVSGGFKAIRGYRVEDSQLVTEFHFRRGDEFHELFDLGADPMERYNLLPRKQEIFTSLMLQYSRLTSIDLQGIVGESSPLSQDDETAEELREREKELKNLGYLP